MPEDELKKVKAEPRVEITNEGTAEEARDLWKEAAFQQARRANKFRDELKVLRDKIDELLENDDDETE